MPKRGTLLSELEQGKILGMRETGATVTDIATAIGRSYNCVNNFLSRNRAYVHAGGPKKKLDEREKRHITHVMSRNNPPSIRNLIGDLNLSASKDTVHRFLKEKGFEYKKAKKRQHLTSFGMQHRLTWAKVLLQKLSDQSLDVKKITFTDEKRFSLDGPDGTQFYWCAPNSEPKIYGKKTFSAGVMIWAGIGYNGTTDLHFCSSTMNSEYYQQVIRECYMPFHQTDFVLMQDNATPHVSAATRSFLREHEIQVLDWAPNSPDCNPIENLWALLVGKIYHNGRRYENVSDLKNAIKDAWDDIDLQIVRKLVMSFPKRLIEVVAAKGGHILKY